MSLRRESSLVYGNTPAQGDKMDTLEVSNLPLNSVLCYDTEYYGIKKMILEDITISQKTGLKYLVLIEQYKYVGAPRERLTIAAHKLVQNKDWWVSK